MDTTTLVIDQIDAGETLINRLCEKQFDTKAAFWVKPSDADDWMLYLVSDLVDQQGPSKAYRSLYDALHGTTAVQFFPSQITLIGPSDKIAKDVLEIQRHYPPGRLPIRSRRSHLGSVAIDEVYIYPPIRREHPGPMTADEVFNKALEVMKRSSGRQRCTVNLQTGSSFQGIPFGLEYVNDEQHVKFVDVETDTPKVYPTQDIASIE